MLATYDGRNSDHCASRTGSTLMAAACLLAIAAAIALLPLRQVLLAAGAVTAALLVLRWPWLILLPLAALLPVTSGIRLGPASITDLLLAAAVGLWFVDGARRRTLILRGSPVIALVAVYAVRVNCICVGRDQFRGSGARGDKMGRIARFIAGGAGLGNTRAGAVGGCRPGVGGNGAGDLGTLPVYLCSRAGVLRPAGTFHARLWLVWTAQSVWRLHGSVAAGGAQPGHLGLAGDRTRTGGALAGMGLGGVLQREHGADYGGPAGQLEPGRLAGGSGRRAGRTGAAQPAGGHPQRVGTFFCCWRGCCWAHSARISCRRRSHSGWRTSRRTLA